MEKQHICGIWHAIYAYHTAYVEVFAHVIFMDFTYNRSVMKILYMKVHNLALSMAENHSFILHMQVIRKIILSDKNQ